jgi:putative PIN family toxin of toxin-antitoxin system
VIRVVVDTNVLVSGLVRRHPQAPPALVIEAWRAGLFDLAVSSHIMGEVERTLQDPYFQRRISPQQAARFIDLLSLEATEVEVSEPVEAAASHPEDDWILATAAIGEARYIVTGDRQLLDLGTYRGTAIISPRQFLGVLAREALDSAEH